MILYFLRHGLAEDREVWQGDDDLRPLTKKGIQRMEQSAGTIADLDLGIDLIVTSPLTRAVQTAEIVAGRLGLMKNLVEDPRLASDHGPDVLANILSEHAGVEQVMLVGHEPYFSEAIGVLIGEGRVVVKKGGLARVDITSENPLHGELVWLIPPKLLAA